MPETDGVIIGGFPLMSWLESLPSVKQSIVVAVCLISMGTGAAVGYQTRIVDRFNAVESRAEEAVQLAGAAADRAESLELATLDDKNVRWGLTPREYRRYCQLWDGIVGSLCPARNTP